MDEELACTVKILTPPMKGANGFGIGLGERTMFICLDCELGHELSTCPGTHPEFAREKTSEDVEAGWPHH